MCTFSSVPPLNYNLYLYLQYIPPVNNWTPNQTDWVPTQNDWAPPAQEWTAPVEQEIVTPPTPMDQLFDMGFGDRQLNEKLLEKHEADLSKVVQELIQLQDNDWHETRH